MHFGSIPSRAVTATSVALLSTAILGACGEDAGSGPVTPAIQLTNTSRTPVLATATVPGVTMYSLVSSDDTLPQSPSFIFGGSADGAGVLKNSDGTFTILTNHEDNFSVSRLTLDAQFRPVKGEYVLNSTGGRWRLCSATMATPEVHGFGPLFLTVGESNIDSQIHGVNPYGGLNTSQILTALGRWNSENAVPLTKAAFPGKTVILIGDDDSGTNGGQLAMYVSNAVGDLNNGKVYVLARQDNNTRERDMVVGQSYRVEFREVENAATAARGADIEAVGAAKNMMRFGRTEDIDYRKGSAAHNREIYFNNTGQNNTGVNADYSRTKYGRVYKLVLDADNPLRGSLEVILDGDDRSGPAREFQNPDNIYVGTNFLYTQEDPNGYGDETHDARIYQYDLRTKAFRTVMELDHRRTAADAARFNTGSSLSTFGSWEFGAMEDISDLVGQPDTFLIAIQPHTWRGTRYVNPDGGTLRPTENQASQLIIVRGLPR